MLSRKKTACITGSIGTLLVTVVVDIVGVEMAAPANGWWMTVTGFSALTASSLSGTDQIAPTSVN